MKLTRTRIAAAALVSTAIVSAAAIIPSYAQDAAPAAPAAAAPAAPAELAVRIRNGGRDFGGPHGGVGIGQDLLTTYDTDGNGTVTQAEIDAVRAEELATYDANGDGTLNLEEYQALWLAKVYERMVDAFQQFDANGDGNVTADEFNAGFANIVALRDADGDGALGPTDRPERPADERVRGGNDGPGNGGGGPGNGPRR